jgi:hypothetical protein
MAASIPRSRRLSRVLWRITAPHFVAGIELGMWHHIVLRAAPIVEYMLGWEGRDVLHYCEKKNWKVEVVEAKTHDQRAVS